MLNPEAQLWLLSGYLGFKAGTCPSGIHLGGQQAAEQGHELHERN